jgi:hypothetical protein
MRRSFVPFLAAVATLALVSLGLASCAGGPTAAPAAPVKAQTEKVFEGAGRDESLLGAMNKAKMDAVRKAVIEMIGTANERANSDALADAIYNTKNPNAFVVPDSLKKLRTDRDAKTEQYIYECSIAVRLDAVEATLRANGLYGGESATAKDSSDAAGAESKAKTDDSASKVDASASKVDAGASKVDASASKVDASASKVDSAQAASVLSAAEQKIIRNYVEHMTWMVYFAEKSTMDPFSAKAAVGIANEYLASNTMEAIDLDQIEKLKADKQKVYESETGESISIVQWIAQKLNADAYIEIDGVVSGEATGKTYYGQANITLKAFEASTGRLLGSAPWNSPKTMSTASSEAARINALQTSVYKAMPVAIGQAKANMAVALKDGIAYELIVQKTPDSRVVSAFRKKLLEQEQVKNVRSGSQSAAETRMQVFIVGTVDDLIDVILDVSGKIPGLEGLSLVLQRGKSVTFNSGM